MKNFKKDKVEGMQKLLERESQRCQDLLRNGGAGETGGSAPADSDIDQRVQGLQQIIDRQNAMIDTYRAKLLVFEKEKKL